MADQRDDAVRKGAHCAWQIHYHIVFPVKDRKALLDEAVTTIIQETAARDCGTVSDRDGSDWDGQESHPSALQCASESGARPDCADVQEHHGAGDLPTKARCEAGPVGGEFWTDGYYVATVGERANWQTVERYVQR